MNLPRPPWTVDLAVTTDAEPDLALLPARPGVLALCDESDRTLTLITCADMRRWARSRLQPENSEQSRRIDYRSITRRIRALTVGSAFEADWAWLQVARTEAVSAYKATVERHPTWWLRADLGTEFPRWHRVQNPASEGAPLLGPLPSRRSATRFIEMLEDAFDLCRYHEILVQAPNGEACMYKEMGRCDAPCDGSVPLSIYHDRFSTSIAFTEELHENRAIANADMKAASARLAFEEAEQLNELLKRTKASTHRDFAHVGLLNAFRFVSVQRGGRKGWCRLFLIIGGWVAPWVDVRVDAAPQSLSCLPALLDHAQQAPMDTGDAALANIGLVCKHLFRPRSGRGCILTLTEARDVNRLERVVQTIWDPSSGPELDEFSINDPE